MTYYFLLEDFEALRDAVDKLRNEIWELGKQQGIANAQSTENFGHDDAVQETIEQTRRVVIGKLKGLSELIHGAQILQPKGPYIKVRLGATVWLSNGKKHRIGSYHIFAEHKIHTISYDSPLARELIGKEAGDEISIRGQKLIIEKVA